MRLVTFMNKKHDIGPLLLPFIYPDKRYEFSFILLNLDDQSNKVICIFIYLCNCPFLFCHLTRIKAQIERKKINYRPVRGQSKWTTFKNSNKWPTKSLNLFWYIKKPSIKAPLSDSFGKIKQICCAYHYPYLHHWEYGGLDFSSSFLHKYSFTEINLTV